MVNSSPHGLGGKYRTLFELVSSHPGHLKFQWFLKLLLSNKSKK